MRYADFKTVNRSHTLPEAVQADHVLYKIANTLFRSLFNGLSPVRLIGVVFTLLTPNVIVQTDLFSCFLPEQSNRLYQGIDSIRKKYGFHSILHARSWPASKQRDVFSKTKSGSRKNYKKPIS